MNLGFWNFRWTQRFQRYVRLKIFKKTLVLFVGFETPFKKFNKIFGTRQNIQAVNQFSIKIKNLKIPFIKVLP